MRPRLDHRHQRSRRASACRSSISPTGMNAYEAILEALIARGRTGEGADFRFRCSTPWPTGWRCRCCSRRPASRRNASGSRASLDRALRRVSRPATAATSSSRSRATANGACWRKRSWATLRLRPIRRFATNRRARAAPRRDRRQGRRRLRARSMRDALMQKLAAADIAFAGVNDVGRRWRVIRICAASRSARRAGRYRIRRRRNGARPHRAAMDLCLRSASTPRRCGRNSWPSSSSWPGWFRPCRSEGTAFQ